VAWEVSRINETGGIVLIMSFCRVSFHHGHQQILIEHLWQGQLRSKITSLFISLFHLSKTDAVVLEWR
jgi:hypothetical protein